MIDASFKQYYLGEAAAPLTLQEIQKRGFYSPAPRCKFQDGDYLVVFGDHRWSTYHSNRAAAYIGKVGKVVGYKALSGACVKYALEFPDKSIEVFHSHYLLGPFEDEQIAKKYSFNPITRSPGFLPKVDPSDIRGVTNSQKTESIETAAKQLFTSAPFNMHWLDTPKVFNGRKYNITVLASKPISETPFQRLKRNTKLDVFRMRQDWADFSTNNLVVFRVNHPLTGNLKAVGGRPFINSTEYIDFIQSAYFFYGPRVDFSTAKVLGLSPFDKDFVKKAEQEDSSGYGILFFDDAPLPPDLGSRTEAYKRRYKTGEDIANKKTLEGHQIFDDMFQAETLENGSKFIKGVSVRQNSPKGNIFGNCIVNNFTICCNDSNITLPKEIRGTLNINVDAESPDNPIPHFKDLSCIPPNTRNVVLNGIHFDSPKGLPERMTGLHINNTNLSSLRDLPRSFSGTLGIVYNPNLASFAGGEHITANSFLFSGNGIKNKQGLNGIPVAKKYDSLGGFSDKDIQAAKKNSELVRDLDQTTKDTFGDFLNEI